VALHESIVAHENVTASIDAKKGRLTPAKRSTNKDIRVAFGWNKTQAKYPSTSKQQLRWDLEIMKLLASMNLPYSTVDHPGFKT
jgi:hypothetical protein